MDSAGESSLCHISESLNCDHALTSPYSELGGVPLSGWGFALNLLISLLALFLLTGGAGEGASLSGFLLKTLSALSAGASLIMAGISLFLLQIFCPVCVLLYLLSFVVFFCVFLFVKTDPVHAFRPVMRALLFVAFGGVLTGVLTHLIFVKIYDIKSVEQTVKRNVLDWMSEPVADSGKKALLAQGPKSALVTVTEFADFLCSFCRKSHYILQSLKTLDPHIRMEYFSFPLDQCKGTRVSCVLTRAVYCAEKQNQGWSLHKLIFKHQKKFIPMTEDQTAVETLKQLSGHLPLHRKKWSECLNSAGAFSFTEEQIKAGENIKIRGTPTLFVNGKRISHLYLTKTIKTIYQKLAKSTKATKQ